MKEQNYDTYKDRQEDEFTKGLEEQNKIINDSEAPKGGAIVWGFISILFAIILAIILVSL